MQQSRKILYKLSSFSFMLFVLFWYRDLPVLLRALKVYNQHSEWPGTTIIITLPETERVQKYSCIGCSTYKHNLPKLESQNIFKVGNFWIKQTSWASSLPPLILSPANEQCCYKNVITWLRFNIESIHFIFESIWYENING